MLVSGYCPSTNTCVLLDLFRKHRGGVDCVILKEVWGKTLSNLLYPLLPNAPQNSQSALQI